MFVCSLNEPLGVKFFGEQEVVTGFLPVIYVLIWRKCLWGCMAWVYLDNALGSKMRLDGDCIKTEGQIF